MTRLAVWRPTAPRKARWCGRIARRQGVAAVAAVGSRLKEISTFRPFCARRRRPQWRRNSRSSRRSPWRSALVGVAAPDGGRRPRPANGRTTYCASTGKPRSSGILLESSGARPDRRGRLHLIIGMRRSMSAFTPEGASERYPATCLAVDARPATISDRSGGCLMALFASLRRLVRPNSRRRVSHRCAGHGWHRARRTGGGRSPFGCLTGGRN